MHDRHHIALLVVDPDESFRTALARMFVRRGFQVQEAVDGESALSTAQRRTFDVAILEIKTPGLSGIELLEKFRDSHSECEVIVLTGEGTIELAVQAMKLGIYDFLTKPFPIHDLEKVVTKAHERGQLRRENLRLKALLQRSQPQSEMVGNSEAMQEVFRLIERAGPSDKAILIQGESGTGKELVARALHHSSLRAEKPMVVINCAALPETLLESELFGHEKGSFTGAVSTKAGLFETADGGTVFIDEIGEMPGPLQAKLLRVLEDGSLRRVGSLKERRVNVRLLAATNRDLGRDVEEGRFRQDLFYRINVMSLELPPLRERLGDIPLLVAHFLGPDWDIEDEALHRIEAYHWPGNVRQLINAIERAKIMGDDNLVRLRDLPRELAHSWSDDTRCGQAANPSACPGDGDGEKPPAVRPSSARIDDLSSLERAKIVEVLRRERGNKTRAARALGIDRRKLYRLVDRYAVRTSEWMEDDR
jgi:DNA-binding NtrC family response regulator